MISQYLPYIFGLTSLVLGSYLFLTYFGIYKPKYKTEEGKIRFEKSKEKFGSLLKICSIIMILNGAYDLIIHDKDRYMIIKKTAPGEWTNEDRDNMINECLHDAGNTTIQYPELTKVYCECGVDKLMKTFTKEQYITEGRKPIDERKKVLLPLYQDCLNQLKMRVDSVNSIVLK